MSFTVYYSSRPQTICFIQTIILPLYETKTLRLNWGFISTTWNSRTKDYLHIHVIIESGRLLASIFWNVSCTNLYWNMLGKIRKACWDGCSQCLNVVILFTLINLKKTWTRAITTFHGLLTVHEPIEITTKPCLRESDIFNFFFTRLHGAWDPPCKEPCKALFLF